MIVKANVKYKNGTRGDEWFLVRFDHTPISQVTKKHRRTGMCSIYYLTNKEYADGEMFASRICGEKFKYFIASSRLQCSEHDNYVKAFARNMTLKKALKEIIAMQESGEIDWDFKFDNDTFKSFITTLNTQHPHGMETAKKLLQNSNYRVTKK